MGCTACAEPQCPYKGALLSTLRPLTFCNSCRYFDEVRILVEARARLQKLQLWSEIHPHSCSMGTKRLSLEVKWPGRETNRLPPYSTDVNNEFKQFINFLHIPLWCVQGYLCLYIFDQISVRDFIVYWNDTWYSLVE